MIISIIEAKRMYGNLLSPVFCDLAVTLLPPVPLVSIEVIVVVEVSLLLLKFVGSTVPVPVLEFLLGVLVLGVFVLLVLVLPVFVLPVLVLPVFVLPVFVLLAPEVLIFTRCSLFFQRLTLTVFSSPTVTLYPLGTSVTLIEYVPVGDT